MRFYELAIKGWRMGHNLLDLNIVNDQNKLIITIIVIIIIMMMMSRFIIPISKNDKIKYN
jgi:thiamine transporter ThiT